MAKRGQFYPYRIKYGYPNGVKGCTALMSMDDVDREERGFLERGAHTEAFSVDRATRARTLLRSRTPDALPEDDTRECAYMYPGSCSRAPEPCDLDAGDGSEYCARHGALMEHDNSDEPIWASEED